MIRLIAEPNYKNKVLSQVFQMRTVIQKLKVFLLIHHLLSWQKHHKIMILTIITSCIFAWHPNKPGSYCNARPLSR